MLYKLPGRWVVNTNSDTIRLQTERLMNAPCLDRPVTFFHVPHNVPCLLPTRSLRAHSSPCPFPVHHSDHCVICTYAVYVEYGRLHQQHTSTAPTNYSLIHSSNHFTIRWRYTHRKPMPNTHAIRHCFVTHLTVVGMTPFEPTPTGM